jgi:hypothetical protein
VTTTSMTELSPAAQAVLDAANGASSHGPDDCLNESRWIAAAALRAAADQVVPHATTIARTDRGANRRKIRSELLAIATELDPSP